MLICGNEDWENRPIKNGLTAEERKRILELHEEQARHRQFGGDLNLLRAMQFGETLRRLKGG